MIKCVLLREAAAGERKIGPETAAGEKKIGREPAAGEIFFVE